MAFFGSFRGPLKGSRKFCKGFGDHLRNAQSFLRRFHFFKNHLDTCRHSRAPAVTKKVPASELRSLQVL